MTIPYPALAALSKARQRLYKTNPWQARSGRWPNCDTVAKTDTHWNDGHYGLLCLHRRPLDMDLTEYLNKHLPGWVLHTSPRDVAQTIFRTTNSNWRP